MLKQHARSKSPLTLLFLITVLIIATLVMVSNYFFRPGLESDLKNKIISTLYYHNIFNAVIKVEGRDVVLNGVAENESDSNNVEADIKNIAGINRIQNNLQIKNQVSASNQTLVD